MNTSGRSKSANGPPLSAAAMRSQLQNMFYPCLPPRAAPPMPPQLTPASPSFSNLAPPSPPPPPPRPPPPRPPELDLAGLHNATPKMQSIANSSAKSGVSHVPFASPAESSEAHMPTASAGLSLTVKGFAGEYRLEARSVEHAAPIVHLMDRIMTMESGLAQQRLHEQQLQNQQLQWQMWSSVPQMCSLLMSDCGQQFPSNDVQTTDPPTGSTMHGADSQSNQLDRPQKRAFTVHADNADLFEEILVHYRDNGNPFALTVQLKLPSFQVIEGTMETKSKYAFAHNCTLLTACGILEDGFIRPSAVDESDTDWVPVTGFYCRGAMIQGNDQKAELAGMVEAMSQAAKYSHCQDGNKPLSMVGVAHSRQSHHIVVHQGGVVAEHSASLFHDAVHGQGDKRWCFRSHLSEVVEATKWSRQQQLANRPVEDIRAYEVCSGGSTNWSLRLIANGRYVSFEAFRSKVDAILWTYVSREIYKHPQLDLNQIIGIKEDGTHQDWDTKLDTIKKFGDEIVKFVESKAPKDPNQQLMEQMEKLKEENARLKQQVSQSAPNNPPPATPAPSHGATNAKGPLDAFVKVGETEPDKEPLDQYRRKPKQPALLSSNSPRDGSQAKLREWIQNNLTKTDQENMEAMMTLTIQEELDSAGPEDKPAIDKILVDWGLCTSKVNKMKNDLQINFSGGATSQTLTTEQGNTGKQSDQ
eukprot:s462_g80.t1